MPAPVSVAAARERARTRVDRALAEWVATGGEDAEFSLPLHPPTERAVLRTGQAAAQAWRDSWQGIAGVELTTRAWPSVGTQVIPERLELRGATSIATFAGASSAALWRRTKQAADAIRTILGHGVSPALASHVKRLSDLDVDAAGTVAEVVAWLCDNPAEGLRVRQVPVPGVDTKWLAQHRALVQSLYATITGTPGLGIADAPVMVRMRVLDESVWPTGPRHLMAPADDWARLALHPRVVLVVENLETLLALPALPGTIAVHGSGYGTGARLRDIAWLVGAERLLYWGDLDSDGLAVLNQLRASIGGFESVLMDAQTLLDHRGVWGTDQKPAALSLSRLTPEEADVRALLAAEGDVRLEQERVLWPYAVERLYAATA